MRGKGKNNAGYKSIDLYKYYKKNVKPIKKLITNELSIGSYDVSNKLFTQILSDFNESIIKMMIHENFEYKVQYNLGSIRIKKYKAKYKFKEDGDLDTRTLPVNWKETKDLWEKDQDAKNKKILVFYSNSHTNGYRYKFYWNKNKAKTKGIKIISFKTTRTNNRYLAEQLKNPYNTLNFFE